MEDAPFGLIELILVFGMILAFAGWQIVSNRRALARLRDAAPKDAPRP